MAILSGILAFKRVYHRRREQERLALAKKEEQDQYEQEFIKKHAHDLISNNACELITEQEFDY